jgi:hypothetical protein
VYPDQQLIFAGLGFIALDQLETAHVGAALPEMIFLHGLLPANRTSAAICQISATFATGE